MGKPGGDDGEGGAREPRHPRWGRRRRRARAGVGVARDARHGRRRALPVDLARGAVRVRAGRGGAARAGRRRPQGQPGGRRLAQRRGAVSSWTTARARVGRSCSSRSAAGRRRTGWASRPSGSSPGSRSRSARICARPRTTGSTRSAMPTAARCSRTWASTRGGIAADVILGKDVRARLGRAALAARDLHRPAGGGGRSYACLRGGRRG